MTTPTEDVQLLTFLPSVYGMRAVLALTAKAVPFTLLPENLPQKSSLLLQSNPIHQKVPVLLHHGNPVCESVVIVEYVDETFPSPHGQDLLPRHPYDRAVCRFWADFCDKKVTNALVKIAITAGVAQKAALEEIKEHFNTLEGAFATIGKEAPYFGGANVGFVDIILGPLSVWLPVFETAFGFDLELHQLPRVSAWTKAFSGSALAECLPAREKLVDYFKIMRKRFVQEE